MCGIIGNINRDKPIENNQLEDLINYSKQLDRRGPDFFDYYLNDSKKIYFGHTRLSIIDLTKNANQPIESENKRYVIVFNGEIYNFKELSQQIPNLDNSISQSDTRVLTEYLAYFGVEKTLKDIRGMFAISVFDKEKNLLFLARDFFGKKPLFFYFSSNSIFFSSTLKPIILNKNIKKKINLNSLDHYFNYGFCPNSNSIFEEIYKVQPNTFIKFDLNKWNITKYSIHPKKNIHQKKTANIDFEHLDSLLKESVEKRLVADVPVGILLSSGIDSSLIAYYSSLINKKIETYTVSFDNKIFDESEQSKKISNYFGLKNNIVSFEKNDLNEIINDLPDAYDEPFADSSQVPTMLIFQKISNFSKVCLTGDGGDEIFYGYNRYQWFLIWSKLFKNNVFNTNFTKNTLTKIIYLLENNFIGKKIFEKLNLTTNKTNKFINIFFNKKNIYESFLKLSNENNFVKNKNIFFDQKLETLDQLRDFDIDNYLVDDILTKVDRSSMFYSVEARSPFLDKDIYDYVLNSKLTDNINFFNKKKILKKILNQKLPNKLISKKKTGFSFPLQNYLYENLNKELINDFEKIKNDDRLIGLNFTILNNIINRFFHYNDYKLGYQVWAIYVFSKWFNKYKKYFNN